MRQFHVAHGHVMLEVDKGLAGDILVDQGPDRGKHHRQRVQHGCGLWRYRCRGGLAGGGDGLFGRLPAAGHGLFQRLVAHHAASTKVLAVKSARHKIVHIGLVHRLDAAVRGQMNRRRPAARHAHQIRRKRLALTGDATADDVKSGQRAARHPLPALNSDDGGGGLHSHASRPGLGQQFGCHLLAEVCHRDLSARTGQGQGIAIGGVVVGGDHSAPTRQHAITVDIGANGATEHDAGSVVTGKHQRALQGATGHHNGLCPHDVQTLARHTLARVGGAGRSSLDHAYGVAVVQAKGRGPRQQSHPAAGFEFSQRAAQPECLCTVGGLVQQRAARFKVLLDQGHIHASAGGPQRSAQTGRPRANHQQISKAMVPVIAVGVGCFRGSAQARRATDEMLIEHPGPARRAHESFVVEARHKKRRQQRVDRHQVKADRGPGVLGARHQAIVQLQNGGGDIGLLLGTTPHGQQRIGFFNAGGQYAARPVVLERATHQVNAVGQQGGGHGLAGIALQVVAIKAEAVGAVALRTPRLGSTKRAGGGAELAHGKALSRAGTTDRMSCVTVWRRTTSQRRQASVCCQNSA